MDDRPVEVVRFEDLSPAVVTALDGYRALVRSGEVEVISEGELYLICRNPKQLAVLPPTLFGWMLGAGATWAEAMMGARFAHQHNYWVEVTSFEIPLAPDDTWRYRNPVCKFVG